MTELVQFGLQIALVALVLMLVPVSWRVVRGPDHPSRLQALEAFAVLLIAILIVLALVQQSGTMVDAGLALAAFSFIATMGIARYMAQGRVF